MGRKESYCYGSGNKHGEWKLLEVSKRIGSQIEQTRRFLMHIQGWEYPCDDGLKENV